MSKGSKTSGFRAPKGVPDYVPPLSRHFEAVRDGLIAAIHQHGYSLMELPIFEETGLFARGVGESTDVVTKEMYTFEDRAGRSLTLRPEGTAGVMRAVIEHNLDRGQLPVKLMYAGPFFRYERPQAGRYRQLQQVGAEAIGVDDPALDAEVISMADSALRSFGLKGYRLELASLGDSTCRPAYRQALQDFLFKLPLDDDTRKRAEINPLRVLDDKRPEVQEMTQDAPMMLDYLSTECKEHFNAVRHLLDKLEVPYTVNPRLVRGLDYYTKTTFEFVHDGLGAQSGIGGGGRYDGLMQVLGGQPLSGIGFGLGVDRILLACQEEDCVPGSSAHCDVFGVPLGDTAKAYLMPVLRQVRGLGFRTDMVFGKRGMKGSFKAADRSGARYALVAGDTEMSHNSVVVKDLSNGEQQELSIDKALEFLQKNLSHC